MIVFEMSPEQAEELIRDLGRAIVLLDHTSVDSDDPLRRHACLMQSHRLWCFARDLEDLAFGRARRERVRR